MRRFDSVIRNASLLEIGHSLFVQDKESDSNVLAGAVRKALKRYKVTNPNGPLEVVIIPNGYGVSVRVQPPKPGIPELRPEEKIYQEFYEGMLETFQAAKDAGHDIRKSCLGMILGMITAVETVLAEEDE